MPHAAESQTRPMRPSAAAPVGCAMAKTVDHTTTGRTDRRLEFEPDTPPEEKRALTPGAVWGIVKSGVQDWISDDSFTLAAAMAYYTIFSLAPLLVLVIAIAGVVVGRGQVERTIEEQFGTLMGPDGQQMITTIVRNAQNSEATGIASVLAGATLLFGATGLFAQLKSALNRIWAVEPKPNQGLWTFVRTRVFSFALVLAVAFLLLASLVVSAALTALQGWAERVLPMPGWTAQAIELGVSFLVIGAMFAVIYKYLPDAKIGWRESLFGGLLTAVLFTVGKYLIGLYIGRAGISSAYGAAGSLVIVLLWVYYSALIFLLGAELTQARARWAGKPIEPAPYARRARAAHPT